VGAEIAFCKLYNIYPDLTITHRSGGYDCITCSGAKVDVKATIYFSGKLLAVINKHKSDADIYVLMVGKFPTYTWVGWAKAGDLLSDENIIDLGYGPTYALSQDKLNKPVLRS